MTHFKPISDLITSTLKKGNNKGAKSDLILKGNPPIIFVGFELKNYHENDHV